MWPHFLIITHKTYVTRADAFSNSVSADLTWIDVVSDAIVHRLAQGLRAGFNRHFLKIIGQRTSLLWTRFTVSLHRWAGSVWATYRETTPADDCGVSVVHRGEILSGQSDWLDSRAHHKWNGDLDTNHKLVFKSSLHVKLGILCYQYPLFCIVFFNFMDFF